MTKSSPQLISFSYATSIYTSGKRIENVPFERVYELMVEDSKKYAKKEGPCLVAGLLGDQPSLDEDGVPNTTNRTSDNVSGADLIIGDFDDGDNDLSPEQVANILKDNTNLNMIIGSSFRDGVLIESKKTGKTSGPFSRWRIVAPLKTPITNAETYKEFVGLWCRWLRDMIREWTGKDIGVHDPKSQQWEQAMYTPRQANPEAQRLPFIGGRFDGNPIDWHHVLPDIKARYPEESEARVSSKESKALSQAWASPNTPENWGTLRKAIEFILKHDIIKPEGSSDTKADWNKRNEKQDPSAKWANDFYWRLVELMFITAGTKHAKAATELFKRVYKARYGRKAYAPTIKATQRKAAKSAKKELSPWSVTGVCKYLQLNFGMRHDKVLRTLPTAEIPEMHEVSSLEEGYDHLSEVMQVIKETDGVHALRMFAGAGKTTFVRKLAVDEYEGGGGVSINTPNHLLAHREWREPIEEDLGNRGITEPNVIHWSSPRPKTEKDPTGGCENEILHEQVVQIGRKWGSKAVRELVCSGCQINCDYKKTTDRNVKTSKKVAKSFLTNKPLPHLCFTTTALAARSITDNIGLEVVKKSRRETIEANKKIRAENKEARKQAKKQGLPFVKKLERSLKHTIKHHQQDRPQQLAIFDESIMSAVIQTATIRREMLLKLLRKGGLYFSTEPKNHKKMKRNMLPLAINAESVEDLRKVPVQQIRIKDKICEEIFADELEKIQEEIIEYGNSETADLDGDIRFLEALKQRKRLGYWGQTRIKNGVLEVPFFLSVDHWQAKKTLFLDATALPETATLCFGENHTFHGLSMGKKPRTIQLKDLDLSPSQVRNGDFRYKALRDMLVRLAHIHDKPDTAFFVHRKVAKALEKYFKHATIRYHMDSGSRGGNELKQFKTLFITPSFIPKKELEYKIALLQELGELRGLSFTRQQYEKMAWHEFVVAQTIQEANRLRPHDDPDGVKSIYVCGTTVVPSLEPNADADFSLTVSPELQKVINDLNDNVAKDAFVTFRFSGKSDENTDGKPKAFNGLGALFLKSEAFSQNSNYLYKGSGANTDTGEFEREPQKTNKTPYSLVFSDPNLTKKIQVKDKNGERIINKLGLLHAKIHFHVRDFEHQSVDTGYLEELAATNGIHAACKKYLGLDPHQVRIDFGTHTSYGELPLSAFYDHLILHGRDSFEWQDLAVFLGVPDNYLDTLRKQFSLSKVGMKKDLKEHIKSRKELMLKRKAELELRQFTMFTNLGDGANDINTPTNQSGLRDRHNNNNKSRGKSIGNIGEVPAPVDGGIARLPKSG